MKVNTQYLNLTKQSVATYSLCCLSLTDASYLELWLFCYPSTRALLVTPTLRYSDPSPSLPPAPSSTTAPLHWLVGPFLHFTQRLLSDNREWKGAQL